MAAKRDDTEVSVVLWDKHVTLIWPQLSPIIPILRKWILNKLCRKILLEFKEFISSIYGTTWTRFLATLTLNRSQIGILERFGKGKVSTIITRVNSYKT